jgi:hypothetical protein
MRKHEAFAAGGALLKVFRKWYGLIVLMAGMTGTLGAAGDAPGVARTVRLDSQPDAIFDLAGVNDCHTQGMTIAGGRLFVSCVDRKHKRGMVYRFDLPSDFPAVGDRLSAPVSVDVTSGSRYHPSGLDHDTGCVWVAAANYRSFLAQARIVCLDPDSLAEKSSFMVEDHLGALAVMGDEIVGLNWDARDFYRFDKKGTLLGKDPSPTGLAYQDCQGLSATSILCSGSIKRQGAWSAAVDTLIFDPAASPHWRAARRTLVSASSMNLGREAFAVSGNFFLFLPHDFPGARLYVFSDAQNDK